MDCKAADLSSYSGRKARVVRLRLRPSYYVVPVIRSLRIIFVCVCALSLVAGLLLFLRVSAPVLENPFFSEDLQTREFFLKHSSSSLLDRSVIIQQGTASALGTPDNATAWHLVGAHGSSRIHESATDVQTIKSISPKKQADKPVVSRIGFGSCTSRVAGKQPIWNDSVIPSDIQAWIWAGDIAYMDWPDVRCAEQSSHPYCNCTQNWLHSNQDSCLAGDIAHASLKLQEQLDNTDYAKFVGFMCPKREDLAGVPDLALCDRPIFGTWDDHDYNWQDGDKRLPTKEEQTHLFLDAFGVPTNSPRRQKGRGIHWKHTLNEGIAGKEIDVLLLDERFHRDTKPCEVRRSFCNLTRPTKSKYIWCQDFLHGGADGKGSCCKKDEQIWAGWCKMNESRANALWESVCNPKAPSYGSADLAIDPATNHPILRTLAMNGTSGDDSTFDEGVLCEVLGPAQRTWLQKELHKSRAALKLVVSGSPLINNPANFLCSKARRRRAPAFCRCFDNFDCFQPAQQNLLHTVASAPGCVVVLTGDFHFSDIKALQPGKHKYSEYYDTTDLTRPVFQVMASGLTTDTAQPAPCDGFRVDQVGLRPNGACDFVSGPSFGMIEIEWGLSPPVAKLQIRGDAGRVLLESRLSLDTCLPL